MRFFISDDVHPANNLIVEAPSFFDARANAEKLLAWRFPDRPSGTVTVEPTSASARIDAELEWCGSDAGRVPDRSLWVRERFNFKDKMGAWERMT